MGYLLVSLIYILAVINFIYKLGKYFVHYARAKSDSANFYSAIIYPPPSLLFSGLKIYKTKTSFAI